MDNIQVTNKIILNSLQKIHELDPNIDLTSYLQEILYPNIMIDYLKKKEQEKEEEEDLDFIKSGKPIKSNINGLEGCGPLSEADIKNFSYDKLSDTTPNYSTDNYSTGVVRSFEEELPGSKHFLDVVISGTTFINTNREVKECDLEVEG